MVRVEQNPDRIENVLGLTVLVGLACALYVGFVAILFAGFTADIQRDFLGRELGASTPGKLERIVLQSSLEAELRQDLRRSKRDLRMLEAGSTEDMRIGLLVRKEAIAGWWAAYDKYAGLRDIVMRNRAAFDPGFVAGLSDAVNRAFALVTDLEASGLVSEAGGDPWENTVPLGLLDVPVGEAGDDAERRAAGVQVMVELRRVLEDLQFGTDADPAFEEQIAREVEAVRAAAKAFDAKSVRAQIEWANIRSGQDHEDRLRSNLTAEIAETSREIERLEREGGPEYRALVALFAHPVGNALFYLIQLPTIMLTLLVTIAAGGLGAVVAFTRDNFAARTQPIAKASREGHANEDADLDVIAPAAIRDGRQTSANGWAAVARLLVLTGEGIAAAMAIFLFTEAGMLMLTQGGPDGTGQVDISPYLVTFMAFVSGFMAEDAFARIQFAGKKIFRVTADENGGKGPDIPTV